MTTTVTGQGDNGFGDTAKRFERIRASNHQRPDHETDRWPPTQGGVPLAFANSAG